jgi:hypothetical protein
MSVQTTADECLDETDNLLTLAIQQLNRVVVERCQGHDDYCAAYITVIRESLISLIKIRADLIRK